MTLWLVLGAVLIAGWFSNRYAWWRRPVDWRRPRVLMYHMVSPHRPGAKFNGLRVTPEHFEAQLAWLQREGWQFFTVSELWEQWDTLPEKVATNLQVSQTPLADTARYDSLRAGSDMQEADHT